MKKTLIILILIFTLILSSISIATNKETSLEPYTKYREYELINKEHQIIEEQRITNHRDAQTINNYNETKIINIEQILNQPTRIQPNTQKIITNNNNDVEIQLTKDQPEPRIEDIIIKKEYISVKNYDETVTVSMYTGNHNVTYKVLTHPEYNAPREQIIEEGETLHYEITSHEGYVTYQTRGFSSQTIYIPDVYIGSITGQLGERWLELHEYTEKDISFISIPDFDAEQSLIIYPEDNYDVNTHIIDGIEYEFVHNNNRYDLFIDVVIPEQYYSKQITLVFTDYTYYQFRLFTAPYQSTSDLPLPKMELGHEDEKSLYIPFYYWKSDFFPQGYKLIPGIYSFEDGTHNPPTYTLGISSSSDFEIDSYGNGIMTTTNYDIELINDESLVVTSKNNDIDFDIRLYVSNLYYATTDYIDINIESTYTPPVTEPIINTISALDVTSSTAKIRGELEEIGNNDVTIGFTVREQGHSSWNFYPVNTVSYPISYYYPLENLKSDTTYEYRAYAYDGTYYYYGDTLTFTTTTTPPELPPINIIPLPLISLEHEDDEIITISNYFSNYDWITLFVPDVDNEQTVILNRPNTGYNEVDTTEYNIKYYSDYVLEINSKTTNTTRTIVVQAGNEHGTNTKNLNIIIGEPTSITGDLLDGLISYWDGNFSGSTAFDVHGENDGTASNTRVFNTDALIGKGFDFTKGDDYVDIVSVLSDVSFNDDIISMSLWYKTSSFSESVSYIVIGHNSWTPRFMIYENDGDIGFRLVDEDWNHNAFDTTGLEDTWIHIVLVANDGDYYFYVNDDLIQSGTYSGNFENMANFYIGSSNGNQGISGLVDEVAIWNRALSSNEVSALYDIQKDGYENGSYPFETSLEPVNITNTINNINLGHNDAEEIDLKNYFDYATTYSVTFPIDESSVTIHGGENTNNDYFYATLSNNGVLNINTKYDDYDEEISFTASNSFSSETQSSNLTIMDVPDFPVILNALPNYLILEYDDTTSIDFSYYYDNFDYVRITFYDDINENNHIITSTGDYEVTTSEYDLIFSDNNNHTLFINAKTSDLSFLIEVDIINDYGMVMTSFDLYVVEEILPGINHNLTVIGEGYDHLLNGRIAGDVYEQGTINLDSYWENIDEFFIIDYDMKRFFDEGIAQPFLIPFNRTFLDRFENTEWFSIFDYMIRPGFNQIIYEIKDIGYNFTPPYKWFTGFGFDIYDGIILNDTEIYYMIPTFGSGIRRNTGLPLISIGENEREETHTINIYDYYDNIVFNSYDYNLSRAIHDVKFFFRSNYDNFYETQIGYVIIPPYMNPDTTIKDGYELINGSYYYNSEGVYVPLGVTEEEQISIYGDVEPHNSTHYKIIYDDEPIRLYSMNAGNGITLSDFVLIEEAIYEYEDEYFKILIETDFARIHVHDKGTLPNQYNETGSMLNHYFNYAVMMYTYNYMDDSYEPTYYEFLDSSQFYFEGEYSPPPLPPTPPGVFDGLTSIFRGMFPDADSLDGYGKFSRIFFAILFVIVMSVILTYDSPSSKSYMIPITATILVLVMFFFIFIGYIPLWILFLSVLIGVGVLVGMFRRTLFGSNTGE